MIDVEAFLSMLLGVVLGGIVSAVITWLSSRESSRELRSEAERLRNLTEILIRAAEDAGHMKANRNSKGETIGLVLELKSEFKTEAGMTANPTVEKPNR